MSTSADCPFVRQLTVADLLATVALRGTVTVSSRQALSSRNPTRTSRLLDGTHGVVAYGVVEASALLAIELLRIPDENHPNAGFSFHLVPEEDWSLYVCFLENTMVLPAARSRGFQRMPLAPQSLMQHRQSCGHALALTFGTL